MIIIALIALPIVCMFAAAAHSGLAEIETFVAASQAPTMDWTQPVGPRVRSSDALMQATAARSCT